jgi:hypothetical protein
VGGEQFRLGVLQAVQFAGDPLAAPAGIRFVEHGPVDVSDAVVMVVQVIDLPQFEVDRVLLRVPVIGHAGLVRRVGGGRGLQ